MEKTKARRRYVFPAGWLLSATGLAWQVLQGQHTFGSPATLAALLALLICTAALLWWLSAGAPPLPSHAARTRRGRFVLALLLAVVVVLFPLCTLVGPPLLFALPTSYLWLRRGLESAMGFHLWLDFVKFVAAYLPNRGLWLT